MDNLIIRKHKTGGRAMTRQEAARIITVILDCCKGKEEDYEEHEIIPLEQSFKALGMAIEALEQAPKWIPVTERLPETGEIVLITETSWTVKGIDVDWWNGEQWVRNGQYVIAWQPLPEPYKEVE